MVFRRRRNTRRPNRRRFRRFRRRTSRLLRSPYGTAKTYRFKRRTRLDPILTPADPGDPSLPVLATYRFALADLPDATDFTFLFNYFRIRFVKISFIPRSNVTLSASTQPLTRYDTKIYTAIDTDNPQTPSSIDEILQYQNVKWSPNNVVHTRFFRPKYQHDSVITNAVQWMRNEGVGPTLFWDGLVVGVDGETTRDTFNAMLYEVVATYYIECKNPM